MPVHSRASDDAFALALPAIACKLNLGTVTGFQHVPEGLMNLNWRVAADTGTYAVKELTDTSAEHARRNLTLLPALHEAGIAVPLPALTDGADPVVSVSGRAYCAVRWLDGEHRHGTGLTPAQAGRLGVVMAQLHQALADLPTGSLPTPLPAADSRLSTVNDALAECDRYLQLIEQLPTPTAFDTEVAALVKERRCLITVHAAHRPPDAIPQPSGWTHGDLQHRNLLWHGDTIAGILDWDRIRVRPLAEEIARTATVQFTRPDGLMALALIAAFVAGYRTIIKIEEGELALAVDRHWWNRLCTLWPLNFHYERDDPGCDHFFFSDWRMLQWWNPRRQRVQQAFAQDA